MMYRGPELATEEPGMVIAPFRPGHIEDMADLARTRNLAMDDVFRGEDARERLMAQAALPGTLFFSVEKDGDWIGYGVLERIRPGLDCWAHGGLVRGSTLKQAKATAEAILQWAFVSLALKRVKTEVCAGRQRVLEGLASLGFRLEGVLSQGKLFNGKPQDIALLNLDGSGLMKGGQDVRK